MEAMQSTIYHLQQSIKETSEQLHQAQEENRRLRATLPPGTAASPAETPGHSGAPEGATPPTQRTDSKSEEPIRLKRTAPPSSPVTTNARLKTRHTDKSTDASSERTDYKSGGARNRGTGSHGNQDRPTAKGSGSGGARVGHHIREGSGPSSESRTPSGTGTVTVTTRQDESSNGRHGNSADPVAMDTNDVGSTEKSRSTTVERDNQRPTRAGNNNSSLSGKTDSSEPANGLVGKHSTLTDACHKV